MKNKTISLRNKAESLLAGKPHTPIDSTLNLDSIEHELRIHHVELEMQNESLRQTLSTLEKSRDRYLNLYEFATVSFITLSRSGLITEINLTGATLLGDDRKKLIGRPFNSFVLDDDKKAWYQYFQKAISQNEKINCELRGLKRNGAVFNVYIESRQFITDSDEASLLMTLTDVTEQKQKEAFRHQFKKRINNLTKREKEVLALALTGLINSEISKKLKISVRTVENHRSQIHLKTGVISLLELSQQAAKSGVLPSEIIELE